MRRLLLTGLVLAGATLGGCTCLDLQTPRAYPCSFDGGSSGQCPDGWTCGLEGQCHQVGQPAGYACLEDLHCEAAWRCGPEGICIDPGLEAARPSAAQLSGTRLSPQLPATLPEAVAGDQAELEGVSCADGPSEVVRVSVVKSGGQLLRTVHWNDGRLMRADGGPLLEGDCAPDAGVTTALTFSTTQVLTDPGGASITQLGAVTYALNAEGAVCRSPLQLDVPPAPWECSTAAGNEALRSASRSLAHHVVAFSPSSYQVYSPEQLEPIDQGQLQGADGGFEVLRELAVWAPGDPVLVALTERGLRARRLSGQELWDAGTLAPNAWEPVAGSEVPCSEDPFELRQITSFKLVNLQGGASLAVVVRDDSEGLPLERLVLLGSSEGPPASSGACGPIPSVGYENGQAAFGVEPAVETCRPCPEGSFVEWFHLGEGQLFEGSETTSLKIEGRCSNPDGGAEQIVLNGTGCDLLDERIDPFPSSARFTRPLRYSSSQQYGTVLADDLGHVWGGVTAPLEAESLDRIPGAIYQTAIGPTVTAMDETFGRALQVRIPVNRIRMFAQTPGGYAAADTLDIPLLAGFEGEPTWSFIYVPEEDAPIAAILDSLPHGSRGEDDLRVIATLPDPFLFTAPYLGVAADAPAGRKLALLASGDSLLAAEVTSQVQSIPGGPFNFAELREAPPLEVKLTPVARTAIQSMAPLQPPAESGPLIEAYLLQGYRVFRIVAQNLTVWRSEEITLSDTGVPVEVFTDGRRARVGMRDGTVYSLPSQLRLSPPVPDLSGEVVDYAQACQHLFALAPGGLFRLEVTDSPIGSWQRVEAADALLPPHAPGFGAGRLHADADALRVFTSTGMVLRLDGFDCSAAAVELP